MTKPQNPSYMKDLLGEDITLYCPECGHISPFDYYNGYSEKHVSESDYIEMVDGAVATFLVCMHCSVPLKVEG